jgi:hypothetical protein
MNIFEPPKFIECDIENQFDVFEHVRKLISFVFRGHRDSEWNLSSSFEREFEKFPQCQMIEGAERYSIDFFKKRVHLHDIGIRKDSKLPDILSCMQHYGCPTRLIDFTESFYIATYFAVCDPNSKASQYSVWAINNAILNLKAREMAAAYFKSQDVEPDVKLKELVYQLLTFKPNGVLPIEVDNISRRMSLQRGILLAQTNIRESFINNLCSMFKIGTKPEIICFEDFVKINSPILNSKVYIIKFNFNDKYIQNIRNELLRLNITSESLFPDLYGLAKFSVEHLFWQY